MQLCGSYSAAELSPPGPALAELRQAQAAGVSLSLYMEESVQELLRDAAERFKGWMSVPGPQHTELACRKVTTALPMAAIRLAGGMTQARGSGIPKEEAAPPVSLCLGLILVECQPAEQKPGSLSGITCKITFPKPLCRHVTTFRASPPIPPCIMVRLCFHPCCPATWSDLPQALHSASHCKPQPEMPSLPFRACCHSPGWR